MALMGSSPEQALTDRQRAALETLLRDLRTIFGARLHALVAYGVVSTNVHESYVRTLGLVERVAFDDLARAVPLAAEWLRRGLAVPLLLSRHEFERTLDVFPLDTGISSPITSSSPATIRLRRCASPMPTGVAAVNFRPRATWSTFVKGFWKRRATPSTSSDSSRHPLLRSARC